MRMFILFVAIIFFLILGGGFFVFYYSFDQRLASSTSVSSAGDTGRPSAPSMEERHTEGGRSAQLILTVLAVALALPLLLAMGYQMRHDLRRRMSEGLSGVEDDPLLAVSLTMWLTLMLIPAALIIAPIREMLAMMLVEKSGISQIILAVILFGVSLCVFQFQRQRREYHEFIALRAAVSRLSADDPAYPERIRVLFERLPRGALKSKWRNLLESSKLYGCHPDFETLVSLVDERQSLKESKVVFSIKALPLLGLLGTVVGFSVALVGMKKAAANMVDFTSFKGNMMETLGGMQTAFLTTLGGIGGMIIVLLLNSMLCEARKRIMLLEDEFLYIHVFLPLSRTSAGQGK